MDRLILTTIDGLGRLVGEEAKILLGENIREMHIYEDHVEIVVDDLTSAVVKLSLFGRTFDGMFLKLTEGKIERKTDLYDIAREVNWPKYWDIIRSFAVVPVTDGSVSKKDIGTLVGQAIVDSFMEKLSERPKVDLENPQIQVYAFVEERKITLALDLCGFEFNSPKEMISRAIVVASEWNLVDGFGELFYGGVAESAFELARNEADRSRVPKMTVFKLKVINPMQALKILRQKWRKEEFPNVTCYETPGRVNVVVMQRKYPIRVVSIDEARNSSDKIFASNIIAVNPKKERQKQIVEEITEIFNTNESVTKLVITTRADILPENFEVVANFKYGGVESVIAIKRK